jgi:SOUL heme-binding protein
VDQASTLWSGARQVESGCAIGLQLLAHDPGSDGSDDAVEPSRSRSVVSMTEQQQYEVVESYPAFELRHYPAHVVAEVSVRGSFEGAGSRAFRSLFGYITGQNESARSIAMTAPVVQEGARSEKVAMTAPVAQTETAAGDYVVAFVLPASLTAETAPVPTNPEVRVRTVPERLAAAVRYSGRWTESAYRRRVADLESEVAAAGLLPIGKARFARFDPPFKPWFLRRNEVVQDVIWPDGA